MSEVENAKNCDISCESDALDSPANPSAAQTFFCAPPSQRWAHLPLFRLLVLLDNTGIQAFDAATELHPTSGVFLRPQYLLVNAASGTLSPLSQILTGAVAALEENLRRLSNGEETIVSSAGVPCDAEECAAVHAFLFASPAGADWKAAVTNPSSLHSLESAFEVHLPLAHALSLHSWWCIPASSSSSPSPSPSSSASATFLPGEGSAEETHTPYLLSSSDSKSSSSALVQQFIIDGLDKWLRQSLLCAGRSGDPPSALQKIVLSCGGVLSPDVVIPLLADPHGVSLLVEFVLDVLFPLPLQDQENDPAAAFLASSAKGPEKENSRGPLEESVAGKEAIRLRAEEKKERNDTESVNEKLPKKTVEGVLDWLMMSYHQNREVGAELELEVDQEPAKREADDPLAGQPGRNRRRLRSSGNAASPSSHSSAHRSVSSDGDDEAPKSAKAPKREERFNTRAGEEKEADDDAGTGAPLSLAPPRKRSRGCTAAATPLNDEPGVEDKPPRSTEVRGPSAAVADAWVPPEEDGDVYLSSENIDLYMRQHPERLPRAVVIAKRKSIDNPSLTRWDLQHHYTATELRVLVKQMMEQHDEKQQQQQQLGDSAGANSMADAVVTNVEEEEEEDVVEVHFYEKKPKPKPLPLKEWERARRMTKKDEFISFLLQLYEREVAEPGGT